MAFHALKNPQRMVSQAVYVGFEERLWRSRP